jgi:hypothetical protein
MTVSEARRLKELRYRLRYSTEHASAAAFYCYCAISNSLIKVVAKSR